VVVTDVAIFWDTALCGPYLNRPFAVKYLRVNLFSVGFEVLTAVVMNVSIFWSVCEPTFRRNVSLHCSVAKSPSTRWFLDRLIWTLKMEVIRSFETYVCMRTTWRYILDGIYLADCLLCLYSRLNRFCTTCINIFPVLKIDNTA
jgi:hypothetical protein